MRRGATIILRLVIGLVLAVTLTLAASDVAGAKVHGVSQAGCANDPSRSGANRSGNNSPDGPIPVTASQTGEEASGGAASPESGGDGNPDCDARS